MILLNLPKFEIQVKEMDKGTCIFDVIRKKYIVLTPEEWVRQHFIHFLINSYKYPKSLMKVESGLKYNNLQKRSDIQVYTRKGHPFLIVECKASNVKLDSKVIDQAALYNKSIGADYIIVTNGMNFRCLKTTSIIVEWVEKIPVFPK